MVIGVDLREVIFISGVIELNNIVVKGCVRFYKLKKNYIIII